MVDTRFKPRRARSRLAAARGYAGRASLCRALPRFAREDAARSFRGLPMVGRAARVSSLPMVAPPARSFRGITSFGRAAHVFGEYLQEQRAESPNGNRWPCVAIERESATQSGDLRTLSPP